jgi:hypothetical protein
MQSSHHRVKNAKAIVALLILGIAFALFYKFITNQSYLMNDPEALRNYVLFAVVGGGFLIGLLYLTSKTEHQEPSRSKAKSPKASKTTKKKKK